MDVDPVESLTAATLLTEVDGLRRKLDKIEQENVELHRKNSELQSMVD